MQTSRKNTYVAIMAGGIGSRFWPASRTARPKQFLDILGVGKSLIRMTFERFFKPMPCREYFHRDKWHVQRFGKGTLT